jgi:hypothetical protein
MLERVVARQSTVYSEVRDESGGVLGFGQESRGW